MPENPGKDLALSEPFMQFGQVLATIGQQVQSGDVPQKVLDAFDYVKSHLQSGGKQVEDAYQTLKKHAETLSQAIVPKLHAQESEQAPAAQSGWTPEPTPTDWTPEGTTTPMNRARVNGQDVPVEDWRQATGKGQVIFSNKVLAGTRDNLPAIGGTIGQIIDGPGGAFVGGLTAERMRQYANAATGVEPLPGQLDASGRMLLQGAEQAGLAYAGEQVPKALTAGAQAVYRSYLKPSLAGKMLPKAAEVVNTALREGLAIGERGAAKAEQIISGLNDQVQELLKNSTGEIDLHEVADRVRMWATKTFYKPGVAEGDYEAALKVADSLDKHATLEVTKQVPVTKTVNSSIVDESGKPFTREVTTNKNVTSYRRNVPMTEAQSSKQGLQYSARNAYGVQSEATTTAQKVAGSELRQAIETQVPKVGPLNARESKLIDAAEAIDRAIGREANQYKIHGGKAIVAGIIGSEEGARTGDPWSAAVKAAAVYYGLQPGVASRAAIVASRLGRMSGVAPASAARIAIAAVTGQSRAEPEQPASNVVQIGPYRVEPQ
jgi:hypothetical protein